MILQLFNSRQFRNLANLELTWNPGFNVIWGRNAQGKTNLLEAVYLLGQLKSFRQARNAELIQQGLAAAKIEGNIQRHGISQQLELKIQANGRIPRINGKTVQRLSQYLGHLRAVLFTPEELTVIRGYPAGRRALLDRAVLQTDPTYLDRVQEYERILRQRNQLLKNQAKPDELLPWSEALAKVGGRLRHDRMVYIERLRPQLQRIYQNIASETEQADMRYSVATDQPEQLIAQLYQDLNRLQNRERQLGQTLAGPHRDDLDFQINRLSLKTFGSQGQQRSFLLAFKAAQIVDQENLHGDPPLLLLDDLASELDKERQAGFVEFLLGQKAQVFITTASPAVLTDAVRQQAGFYHVDGGRVVNLSPQ